MPIMAILAYLYRNGKCLNQVNHTALFNDGLEPFRPNLVRVIGDGISGLDTIDIDMNPHLRSVSTPFVIFAETRRTN